MIVICPKCGKEYEIKDEQNISKYQCTCGEPLGVKVGTESDKSGKNKDESKLMYCPDCGHQVSKKAKTCPNCGRQFKKARNVSPGLAFFLGLFIGPFGYLYLHAYLFFFIGLIVGLFLGIITGGIIGPLLWIAFGIHQYTIAKEMKKAYISFTNIPN